MQFLPIRVSCMHVTTDFQVFQHVAVLMDPMLAEKMDQTVSEPGPSPGNPLVESNNFGKRTTTGTDNE